MIDASAIVATERSARDSVPAAMEIAIGRWMVRINGGATKRVNSANPIAPGARVDEVIGETERLYAEHGQPARFRLTPLADAGADTALAGRGYRRIDESLTMTAAVIAGRSCDRAVHLAGRADAAWCRGFAAVSGWSDEQDASHRALLAGARRLVVATLVEDGRAVGFGAAAIAHGQACLFDIATLPEARGRGIGRRIVETLLGRAAADGAGTALLQVFADNAPARALYRSLGFVDAYPYHYRVAGSGEQRGDLGEV